MKQLYSNNAKTVLQNAIGPTDSSIVVVDGSSFPSPGANEFFMVTVEVDTQREIMMCTGRTGGIFTIANRGMEGTTPASFAAGAKVENRITRDTLYSLSTAFVPAVSIESILPPSQSRNTGYICGTYDPAGNPAMVITKTASLWRFLNYTIQLTATATAGTANSVTATGVSLSAVTPGKYLIQFTSGALSGFVRAIDSVAGGVVSWTAVTPSSPQIGDTFEIVKANSSILLDALAIGDDAVIMPLILGGN